MAPRTMFEKIWDSHVVREPPAKPALIYVDLHLIHEVTSPQAFEGLRLSGRSVRRPDLTVATVDHNVPTIDRWFIKDEISRRRDAAPPRGVTAKDVILGIIGSIGVDGAVGHVIEYTGEAIRTLSMEGRMTVCNMSIEAGARAGMIAPDETTIEYLEGREFSPKGQEWEAAVAEWQRLPTDEGARFDKTVVISASELEPYVTWGKKPGMGVPVTGRVS